MGLFSGGFGTGLATGLAESVDQSLKTAMDKRDKEISRARQFWETRQAQKMDLADEHDRRAEAALGKMIGEFKGDVAKGLAAYQAVGGDVDSVEAYLADLTDTRKAVGQYDITEKLNLDGVDMSQFADITREQALGSIRMEVKPVDVQMEDTGLLSKVGLGMKNMGEAVSTQINQNIPPREREAIANITGATMDRSGMISNLKHKAEMQNQIGSLENQLSVLSYQIQTGKEFPGSDIELDEVEKNNREIRKAEVLSTMGAMKRELDPDSGPSAATVSSLYARGLSELTDEHNFQRSDAGIATATNIQTGQELVGPEALAYFAGVKDEWKKEFVKNSILDDEGNYVSRDAQYYSDGIGLGDYVEAARGEEPQPESEAAAAEVVTPSADEIMAQTLERYPTAGDFAAAFAEKAESAESLFSQLAKFYPQLGGDELSRIAMQAMENKPKPLEFNPDAAGGSDASAETDAASRQSPYHQRIYGTVGE